MGRSIVILGLAQANFRTLHISIRRLSEFLLNGNFLEGFDDVAFLDVVAVGETDTTLEVGCHFLHVVLETLQGVDFAREDDNAVANQAGLVGALNLTVDDISTGNVTHLGDVVNLAHFDSSCDFFLDDWFEHALHGFLDFFNGIVDDRVETNVNTIVLSELAGGL